MLAVFVFAAALLYFGEHRNPLWALSGNAVLFVSVLLFGAMRGKASTGRQRNLPEVDVAAEATGLLGARA
jgi:hypothetical protein